MSVLQRADRRAFGRSVAPRAAVDVSLATSSDAALPDATRRMMENVGRQLTLILPWVPHDGSGVLLRGGAEDRAEVRQARAADEARQLWADTTKCSITASRDSAALTAVTARRD
jgi:hypothetical protein